MIIVTGTASSESRTSSDSLFPNSSTQSSAPSSAAWRNPLNSLFSKIEIDVGSTKQDSSANSSKTPGPAAVPLATAPTLNDPFAKATFGERSISPESFPGEEAERKSSLRINSGYHLSPAAVAAVQYWTGTRSWSETCGSEKLHIRGAHIVPQGREKMTAVTQLQNAFRKHDKNLLALITILSDVPPFDGGVIEQVNFNTKKTKDILEVALQLRSMAARNVKPSDGLWTVSDSQEVEGGRNSEVLSIIIPGKIKGQDLRLVINRSDERVAHAFSTGTFRPNTKLETHIFSKGLPGEAIYYNPPPMGISGQVWLEARSLMVFVGDFNGQAF